MSGTVTMLREVVELRTGTRNPTVAPEEPFTYVDVAAVDNEQKAIVGARVLVGAEAPSRARKLIRKDDVLVSTVRPNLNAVAVVPTELDGQVASTGFCVLRAKKSVLPEFLYFYTRSQRFVDGLCKLVAGAMYPAVTDAQVLDQTLPIPSLQEQRHIVDLLARAEGIVRLRREAQQKAAELIPAIFIDMFGDPATNPRGWPVHALGSLAEAQGGLQVTRARAELPLERPYLRVANVHRGRLDLTEMKSICLTEAEFRRTALQAGDLLVVEGHGNPHEVGRVATWDNSIPDCTHQNHLIRARPRRDRLLPEYACALLNSEAGRQTLLRAGKTTSGLSTISAQNVKNATMMLPPVADQGAFARYADAVASLTKQQAEALNKATATFDAILSRAFH